MCGCMHTLEFVTVREQLEDSIFPFHLVDPRDPAQVFSLDSNSPYPLSHFVSPKFLILKIEN